MLHSNKLCIGFNFKREYAKMSQRENTENMKNNFRSDGYKCYNECSFAVGVCEKILIKKKMGDSVLQVTDHSCQAQLGH